MTIIGTVKAVTDTVDDGLVSDSHTGRVSHDMPCQSCGHATHTFLACGDGCACQPVPVPGLAA